MSGLKVERPRQLDLKRVSFDDRSGGRHSPTFSPSPKKLRLDPDFRPRRRRTHSCSFIGDRKRRQGTVVPTKFLLGGSITDPLNLEALGEENNYKIEPEPMKRGCETVKVIIPPNINDPLNLDACSEDGEEQLADAISRQRRRRKCRQNKRKRRNSEPTSGVLPPDDDKKMSASFEEDLCKIGSQPRLEVTPAEAKSIPLSRQISCPAGSIDRTKNTHTLAVSCGKASNKRWRPKCDRIVSPVVKQPGVKPWHYQAPQCQPPDKSQDISSPKSYHPKNQLYQYGNYSQYYGYRNPHHMRDPRLNYFQRIWFEGKDVLDIGCNIGLISFIVARDFQARKVIGIDIDKKLITTANQNYKHYLPDCESEQSQFPKSMRTLYGPLNPAFKKTGIGVFPYNVRFYQNNYVLESDELLETIREEFDCVLCLSVTKWVHLNFGDDGLKRFFSRIYHNLRPDGLLILEPQAWPSYKKKRKLTPKIFNIYKNIQFFPTDFEEYLTKKLGFFHVHTFRVDHTFSKGFHRLLCIFRKPTAAERKNSLLTFTHDKSVQTEDVPVSPTAPQSDDLPVSAPVPEPVDMPVPISHDIPKQSASPTQSPARELVASPAPISHELPAGPAQIPTPVRGAAPVVQENGLNNVNVAGPSGSTSPESTSSKSSLVESTELLAINVESKKCGTSAETPREASPPLDSMDVPEGNSSCGACSNSPTVGSTTDNFSNSPIPSIQTVSCDSTTDEVYKSESQPSSPQSENHPEDKS